MGSGYDEKPPEHEDPWVPKKRPSGAAPPSDPVEHSAEPFGPGPSASGQHPAAAATFAHYADGGAKYLREIELGKGGVASAFTVPAGSILATEEYRSYVNPTLAWQRQLRATADEALLACRLMLLDFALGRQIDWDGEARRYLVKARAQLGKPEEKEAAAVPSEEVPVATVPEAPHVRVERGVAPVDATAAPDAGTAARDAGRDRGPEEGAHDDSPQRASRDDGSGKERVRDFLDRVRDLVENMRRRGEHEAADRIGKLLERSSELLTRLGVIVGPLGAVVILYSEDGVAIVLPNVLDPGDLIANRLMARAEQLIPDLEQSLADLHREVLQVTDARGAGVLRRPRHHVFPQEYRAFFEERGFKGALDIDNFCVEMEVPDHEAIHGGGDYKLARKKWEGEWNRRVMSTLNDREAEAGRRLTVDEISREVFAIMKEYRMPRDFVPFRDSAGVKP